jgi:D-3-phosphoglycerate dehydrogenase / 2-oxoglutarate reductase
MAPRVLISDKLSEAAVQIFRDRGVEVKIRMHFSPKLASMMALPFAQPPK